MNNPKLTRRAQIRICKAMLGCGVFHQGEHGEVIAYTDDYHVPMLVVRFAGRAAIMKPSEIGAES